MLKKVAIFCGGPSSEHEVSISSASTIFKFIDKKKYNLYFFYISKDSKCKLLKARGGLDFSKLNVSLDLTKGLKKLKEGNFFAFLAGIHGEFVEDGKIQTLLEYFKIPYSGSGPSASSLAMDKYRSSLLVGNVPNVNLPKMEYLSDKLNFPKSLNFPVIIKPNTMGSSVGVSIAQDLKEFNSQITNLHEKYPSQEVIVQEYLEGILEIQCATLRKKNGDFLQVPPIEIIPKKNVFFDYESKYKIGGSTEITPPVSISKEMSEKISDIACEIHKLLGLKTYSRSDFLVKENKIYYLETNTLPGMTSTSLLPQEAAAAGISFPQLLDFIIEN